MFLRMKRSFDSFRTSIRNKLVERYGRKHASKAGEPMADLVVLKFLGPEMIVDVEHNEQHKRTHAESQPDPRVATWQQELGDVEKELTKHSSRVVLWLAFVFLLVVEFAGISQLLHSQGMENPQRTIVAIAGSCILFYLTYHASKQAVAKKKSVWFYLLLVVIGLFIFAVALLRRDETTTDQSSAALNFASAIFMTVVTLGPGLLAKEVFAALIPILQLAKNRRRLRKEIKTAEEKRLRAVHKLDQLHLASEWWRQEAAQITAVYLLAYREAGGRVVTNPYARQS